MKGFAYRRLVRLLTRDHGEAERLSGKWTLIVMLAIGLCLAISGLVALGYIATREWRHGTELLMERRTVETLALTGAALDRDMRGAGMIYLTQINRATIDEQPPFELLQLTARAFALFPYVESFVIWTDNDTASGLTFALNRSDKLPPWSGKAANNDPYPVVLERDPAALAPLVGRIRRVDDREATPFVVLDETIRGTPYQIVVHRLFKSSHSHTLYGFAAFTVDLRCVRKEYFGPLLDQVARIGGTAGAVAVSVVDGSGTLVTSTGTSRGAPVSKRFPMLFIDPALVVTSGQPPANDWTLTVQPAPDNTAVAALEGARRVIILMTLAAGLSFLALLLTARALRASVVLTSMRSEFVATVTHELKTPLALIQLVGETLARGRYTSPEKVSEYAELLSHEAVQLGDAIDNLLAFARYSDSDKYAAQHLKPNSLSEIVEDALERFRPKLQEADFDVSVDVPHDLPPVAADRPALIHAVQNIVDNAIKYASARRRLRIAATTNGSNVKLTIADAGMGIPKEEMPHVFEQFYRGQNATSRGSGLGLAIVRRVLSYHGGTVGLRSSIGNGTEGDLILPKARWP